MKTILQRVGIALAAGVLLYGAAMLFGTDRYWCFKDSDTCIVDEMNYWRDKKAADIAAENLRHEGTIATLTSYYDDTKINPLKPKLSTGRAIEEVSKGNVNNVPAGLVTLRNAIVPQANASELSPPTPVIVAKVEAPEDIYGKIANYLSRKNAPYKDLDFEHIARKIGITDEQALMLVAITGHESSFGNSYARSEGKKVISASIDEGRQYHNYAGVKRCIEVPVQIPSLGGEGMVDTSTDCPEANKIPDDRGFWLQKYPDDETFFITFFAQMKKGYFDKGCDTAGCIRQWYVGGNYNKKAAWSGAVNAFIKDIKETKAY